MRRIELLMIREFYRFFNFLGKAYPAYQKRKDSNLMMLAMVMLAMVNFLLLRHIVIPYNDQIITVCHFFCILLITGIAMKLDLDHHPKNTNDTAKVSLDLSIVFVAALIVPTLIINGIFMIDDQFEIVK